MTTYTNGFNDRPKKKAKSNSNFLENLDIVVLIPCYNEELTVAKVVTDFRKTLPQSNIYVYDNNSTDNTKEIAKSAGAIVRSENLQGKGYVVRRMFADIDADIYILVDGDDTYNAASAPELIESLLEGPYDLINASRSPQEESQNVYRTGHKFGNNLLTMLVSIIFGKGFNDMLSGYKVFSRRFVKSFPALSKGFEIETELTIHALELGMAVKEIPTPFFERPPGSSSKLRTFSDGIRIIKTIGILLKEEKPFRFFGTIFLILFFTSTILAIPIFITFFKTGLVPRFPTAILSTGLMVLAFISLACALILDTVTLSRKEMKRLMYLKHSFVDKQNANTFYE